MLFAVYLHYKMNEVKPLTIRLPENELTVLKAYCEQEGRNQTDVIREFIRSLKTALKD